MTVRLHWSLPTGGDGRTLVDRHAYAHNASAPGVREPDVEYLAQIAKAAERLGFEAVLTPTGTWCEDAWLTTVAPSQHTERLKFLVAFRPGVISPTLAAQMAATYQRITRGRLTPPLLGRVAARHHIEQERGRTVRFGIRLHTISRDSAQEAWGAADRLLGDLSDTDIARAQSLLGVSESVGSSACWPCTHGGSRDGLEISPNLWAGVGLVRGGAGTALVGSHGDVADRIEEYRALGIENFVLSGYPHLEEAYWFGEGVTPELAARVLLAP
ncbi:LLM class flavin-dependent oxidoreductase [Streptomyces sp. NPDC085639]|uniref:LLM class flavin-dependent oxidoreductase n=1 Tax=Streptomyces sp. NPDC085639 TaxID=3365734 RepID=UPI0037CF05EE